MSPTALTNSSYLKDIFKVYCFQPSFGACVVSGGVCREADFGPQKRVDSDGRARVQVRDGRRSQGQVGGVEQRAQVRARPKVQGRRRRQHPGKFEIRNLSPSFGRSRETWVESRTDLFEGRHFQTCPGI